MKKLSFFVTLMLCSIIVSITALASDNINVIINGKTVNFTESTGYPYVDENNRTMVPLRATMEATGAAVGYDTNESTAIVITEHDRIEIPIGTSILYNNNVKIQNDTYSVVYDNRTYLPIRAVLESAEFTVEWDTKTNTVNAYTFKFDPNELVPYSTSNLDTLSTNLLNGNVVYINGEYYATPKYMKSYLNTKVTYLSDDLNKSIYPQESRFDDGNYKITWMSGGLSFGKISVKEDDLNSNIKNEKSNGYVKVYAFYESDTTNIKVNYIVDEMTDEFMNAQNATGTFNGIRMKKENGRLFFYYDDLKLKNLC